MNISALGRVISNIDIGKCGDTITDIAQERAKKDFEYEITTMEALCLKGKEYIIKNIDLLRKGNREYCLNRIRNCRTGQGLPVKTDKLKSVMCILVQKKNDEEVQKLMADLLSWKAPLNSDLSGADIILKISDSSKEKELIGSMLKLEEILIDKKMDREEVIQVLGNTMDYVSDIDQVNFSLIKKVAQLYASPNKYSQELAELASLKDYSTLYELDDALTDMLNKKYF